MIRVLTNLGEAVAIYGIIHQNKEEDERAQKALLNALTEIEIDSNHMYISHSNHKMARQSFRTFYSQLRLLFNIIYRKKHKQVDPVILKFHELFTTYKDIYSQDMDLHEPLSEYQYQLLKADIIGKLPAIKEALSNKGILQYLILEIQSAIDNHFSSSSSELQYHHFLFYNRLLKELTRIAQDTRQKKDWERRFIETMININFNHMGFFNRCSELINYQLQNLCEDHQIMSIDINGLRISQASRDPKLSFDTTRRHLADLLIEYAEQRKTIKKPRCLSTSDTESNEIKKPDEVSKPNGIPTQLYASHINLFTHYMHLADVYPEDMSKREICSYVSNHILTKRGQFVSKVGLEKFDRQKLESGAEHVHGILTKMIQAIERDFDHLVIKNRK